MRRSGKKNF